MKARQETNFGTIFQPWPLKPLPDVAFFQEGPGLRKWQWTESGMKVINVTNILGDGSVDVNNTDRFISTAEFESKYRHFAVDAGDIVVASSGNTYGKVGRINHSHLPIMMNTSVIRFHPADPDTLDKNFLFSFLRSHLFKNQMESFVIGSAQPNFGPSHLKRMVIPFPDITTQRKIAGVLSAYDDLIENNTRRIAILEEMAQAIYREWFVNFRFPEHENVKLVDSPLGKIPEGWKVGALGDIAKIVPGFAFSSKDWQSTGIPVIKIKNIEENNNVNTDKVDYVSESIITPKLSKFSLMFGDMLIAMTGATSGKIGKLRSRKQILLNQRVAKIAANPDYRTYIWCEVSKKDTQHRFFRLADGAAQPNMSGSQIESFSFVIPPVKLCQAFSDSIDPILNLSDICYLKNIALRKTRNLLLPKLISGELDVEDLDVETGDPLVVAEA